MSGVLTGQDLVAVVSGVVRAYWTWFRLIRAARVARPEAHYSFSNQLRFGPRSPTLVPILGIPLLKHL